MTATPTIPDIADVIASLREKWVAKINAREFVEDLMALVNFERERCAKIAVKWQGGSGYGAAECIEAEIRGEEV